MPKRKRTGRRTDLTLLQSWELVVGPRTCGDARCSRLGHVDAALLAVGPSWADAVDVRSSSGEIVRRLPLCSEFASEEDRAAAWYANQVDLLAEEEGTRPWAWWRYESGLGGFPRGEGESLWLASRGFLSEAEEARLLAAARPGRKGAFADSARPAAAVILQRRLRAAGASERSDA